MQCNASAGNPANDYIQGYKNASIQSLSVERKPVVPARTVIIFHGLHRYTNRAEMTRQNTKIAA